MAKRSSNGKPRAPRGPSLDHATFVKTWHKSASAGEASEALGISPQRASAMARRFRQAGVDLKSYRNSTPIDAKALNALLRD